MGFRLGLMACPAAPSMAITGPRVDKWICTVGKGPGKLDDDIGIAVRRSVARPMISLSVTVTAMAGGTGLGMFAGIVMPCGNIRERRTVGSPVTS